MGKDKYVVGILWGGLDCKSFQNPNANLTRNKLSFLRGYGIMRHM